MFDLIVEKEVFICGLTNLEDAVSSFLHLCFVANMEYPKVLIVRYKRIFVLNPINVERLEIHFSFGWTSCFTRNDNVRKHDLEVSKINSKCNGMVTKP